MGWLATAVFVGSYFVRPSRLLAVQVAGALTWLAYGLLTWQPPVIVSNVVVAGAAAFRMAGAAACRRGAGCRGSAWNRARRTDRASSAATLSRPLHADAQREQPAEHERAGEQAESERVVAGEVPQRAHDVRADEAAEIADRVDHRDAAGGGRAAEERRRQPPERRDASSSVPTRRAQSADDREPGAIVERPQRKAGGRAPGRERDVPVPLAASCPSCGPSSTMTGTVQSGGMAAISPSADLLTSGNATARIFGMNMSSP